MGAVAALALVGLVALAMLLSACSDDVPEQSAQEDAQQQASQAGQRESADSTDTSESADSAQTTDADSDVTEPSPSASSSSGSEPGFAITGDTVWREVFDTLSADEQSCIREALDAESLGSALATRVAAEDDPQPWEIAIFSCLDPQFARSLFVAIMVVEIQSDGEWELSGAEVTCLDEWSAEIDVFALLAASAEDDSAGVADYLSSVVSCIPDLMVSAVLEDSGVAFDELSEAEASCLRNWVVEIDWAALTAASESDDLSAVGDFAGGMFACVPTLFVESMLADSGTSLWELGEAERSCLGAWSAEADWGLLMSAYEADDATALGEFMPGLVACLPDLMVAIFISEWGMTIDELTQEESLCLRGWVSEGDWATLLFAAGADEETAADLAAGLLECVPELLAQEPAEPEAPMAEEADFDQEDDHSDTFDEVGIALVGESVAGMMDYEYDLDILAYELEAGQFYRIDVELETLSDSVLTLYDGDSLWLASNDDHGGSTASRIYWTAAGSGIHYVEVSGYGGDTGSYTLTVEALEIEDDHANSIEDATPAAVGVEEAGSLDYEGDLDVFAAEFEAGRLYQIDVALGTLSDSVATLYDGEGAFLATNDDRPESLASRIYWEATSTGTHYIEVSAASFGSALAGSYTLTVVQR